MKDQDNDPFTLHDAVSEAVFLLSSINLITNPDTDPDHEALSDASEHIDEIERYFNDQYALFLEEESLSNSDGNLHQYIASCFGYYRTQKLQQLTELYRCLKTIEFYAARKVSNLSPQLSSIASNTHDIEQLKADIIEELDEMSRSYDPDKSCELQDLYMETSAKLRPQLSDPIDRSTETYSKINAFMSDIVCSSLMHLTKEFELIIGVAAKYNSFADNQFKKRHVHLNNLMVRIGAIAKTLINEPQWEQVDWGATAGLSGTHKPLRPN